MSRSSVSPVLRQETLAEGSAKASATSSGARVEGEDWMPYLPAPADLDEAERTRQIRAMIDRGMDDVRAGRGYDWDTIKQELREVLPSRRT